MTYRVVTDPPNWSDLINMKVRVHRNLRTKMIVIQAKEKRGWTVAGVTRSLLLKEVQFIINENRHKGIVSSGKRHVCAWAQGVLVASATFDITATPVQLGYNPFKSMYFYDQKTGEALVHTCSWLAVIDNEAFVSADALLQKRSQQYDEPLQPSFNYFSYALV